MKHFKISCPTTEATDTPQEEADVGTFLTRCAHLDEITQGVVGLRPSGNPTS